MSSYQSLFGLLQTATRSTQCNSPPLVPVEGPLSLFKSIHMFVRVNPERTFAARLPSASSSFDAHDRNAPKLSLNRGMTGSSFQQQSLQLDVACGKRTILKYHTLRCLLCMDRGLQERCLCFPLACLPQFELLELHKAVEISEIDGDWKRSPHPGKLSICVERLLSPRRSQP